MNRHTSLKLTAFRMALGVSASLLAVPGAAIALEAPKVISPPRVHLDGIGIHILNGKISIDVPTLSLRGAPRLTFDGVQNTAPHVNGIINITARDTPRTDSCSSHGGGGSLKPFKCNDGACVSVNETGSTLILNAQRSRSHEAPGTKEHSSGTMSAPAINGEYR